MTEPSIILLDPVFQCRCRLKLLVMADFTGPLRVDMDLKLEEYKFPRGGLDHTGNEAML